MRIDGYYEEFLKLKWYDKDLKKTAKKLLTENKPGCLPRTKYYAESDYLAGNIQDSVQALPRGKETAIEVYKRLVDFLKKKGVEVSINFPPIPIENSFESQMYIAKYLQDQDHRIEDIGNLLWVSERTINEDLLRLRGEDPIQVCGRRFVIDGAKRSRGQMSFASTAHPLFLTENLTQVLVMLKGLHAMAENPLYTRYAEASAADIWVQLSDYAKNRIRFVLGELLPEDLSWYESLESGPDSFTSERQCSVKGDVLLECLKNEKSFFVEYREEDGIVIYENCRILPRSSHPEENTLQIMCRQGKKTLAVDRVLRSAYTVEELTAD